MRPRSVLGLALALAASSPAGATTWERSCADNGLGTWGVVDSVVAHEPSLPVELHTQLARVHRRTTEGRTSTTPTPGMVLCRGDWIETWHGTEVLVRAVEDREARLIYGGTLVQLDEGSRQVRGTVDYYVLRPSTGTSGPLAPVPLGTTDRTADRPRSFYRIEILDSKSGDSLIAVSAEGDLFESAAAPVEHQVSLSASDGRAMGRVQGGGAARVVGEEVRTLSPAATAELIAEVAEAKARVDAHLVEQGVQRSTEPVSAPPKDREVLLVLEGTAYPDAVYVDGVKQEPLAWRPAGEGWAGDRLLASAPLAVTADPHELMVVTWDEQAHAELAAGDSPATVEVGRDVLPRRSVFAARQSIGEPYVRPAKWSLSAGVGAAFVLREYSVWTETEPGARWAMLEPDGWAPALELRAARRFNGGRLWARAELSQPIAPSNPLEFQLWLSDPSVAFGLAGGNALAWQAGLGVIGRGVWEVDQASDKPSLHQRGILVSPALVAEGQYQGPVVWASLASETGLWQQLDLSEINRDSNHEGDTEPPEDRYALLSQQTSMRVGVERRRLRPFLGATVRLTYLSEPGTLSPWGDDIFTHEELLTIVVGAEVDP